MPLSTARLARPFPMGNPRTCRTVGVARNYSSGLILEKRISIPPPALSPQQPSPRVKIGRWRVETFLAHGQEEVSRNPKPVQLVLCVKIHDPGWKREHFAKRNVFNQRRQKNICQMFCSQKKICFFLYIVSKCPSLRKRRFRKRRHAIFLPLLSSRQKNLAFQIL